MLQTKHYIELLLPGNLELAACLINYLPQHNVQLQKENDKTKRKRYVEIRNSYLRACYSDSDWLTWKGYTGLHLPNGKYVTISNDIPPAVSNVNVKLDFKHL